MDAVSLYRMLEDSVAARPSSLAYRFKTDGRWVGSRGA
jgi:hypothetical protein